MKPDRESLVPIEEQGVREHLKLKSALLKGKKLLCWCELLRLYKYQENGK